VGIRQKDGRNQHTNERTVGRQRIVDQVHSVTDGMDADSKAAKVANTIAVGVLHNIALVEDVVDTADAHTVAGVVVAADAHTVAGVGVVAAVAAVAVVAVVVDSEIV